MTESAEDLTNYLVGSARYHRTPAKLCNFSRKKTYVCACGMEFEFTEVKRLSRNKHILKQMHNSSFDSLSVSPALTTTHRSMTMLCDELPTRCKQSSKTCEWLIHVHSLRMSEPQKRSLQDILVFYWGRSITPKNQKKYPLIKGL